MIFEIPLVSGSENPLYRQRTALDGKEYNLHIDWNGRSEAWYLDLYDQDNVAVCLGVKLVQGADLFGKVSKSQLPGKLFILAQNGDRGDPGIDDLGSVFRLFYFDAEEVAETAEPLPTITIGAGA